MIGIVIALGGVPTLGIWFVAFASIGIFVSLSGIAGTRYQREVLAAIRPISRSNVRRAERADGRRPDLERIEYIQPPPELSVLRAHVIDAMRGQLMPQTRQTVEEVMRDVPARVRRWKTLARLGDIVDESITSSACWAELRQVVLHFLAEEDDRVRRHHERALNAVGALRHMVPPKHKAVAHQALIRAIDDIDDLIRQRRDQYQAGDESGIIKTTCALVEHEQRLRAAIKMIRGWL